MKRLAAVSGKPFARYLIIASFTGLLVGCGGGSGDTTDGDGIDLGDVFDPDDVDGDGIPNAEDIDFSPTDLDGDGIPNIDDDDVDGDGIINSLDEDYVPGDADGDGFTDPSASDPCGSERGTDSNSSNANWDDNCHIERSITTGQFADSLYSAGIQRVVYCSGDADSAIDFATYPDFAAFSDGEYGPASEAATEAFQAINSPPADGIVGAATWGALRDEISLLTPGTAGADGVAYDAYGFSSGRCAGTPLFYQASRLTSSGIVGGGWTLARNPPNSTERVEFSTAAPFGRL